MVCRNVCVEHKARNFSPPCTRGSSNTCFYTLTSWMTNKMSDQNSLLAGIVYRVWISRTDSNTNVINLPKMTISNTHLLIDRPTNGQLDHKVVANASSLTSILENAFDQNSIHFLYLKHANIHDAFWFLLWTTDSIKNDFSPISTHQIQGKNDPCCCKSKANSYYFYFMMTSRNISAEIIYQPMESGLKSE